ncbi:dihydrofolate reductase [Devosia sp.]|uniref:dihydrofolate reductase n=1 Tax=Devosia sp. TaxID=1871048 RepID=UPI0026002B2B|nr:dihydrofolate reductase [Devosia sp.]MCR6634356.1 dihydrofolate reductase [Devosia sp.]
MTPRISLIAAVGANSVIGKDGDMPWRIPSDFAWFKRTTMGKPMIMGRKQFETFPKPLAGRPHIVVTRQQDYAAEGVDVVHDLDAAYVLASRLAVEAGADEIMVIGGGDIYAQAMMKADRLYISHVELSPDGDVRFPSIDPEIWAVVDTPEVTPSEKDAAPYRIKIYERRKHPTH